MAASAREFTKNWFDQLETILHEQAEIAGLLGHGTMIGNAREFFISNVLRSVLPPTLHIGTGRIIANNGELSNQIDVIIYDPTFPVFEVQPGMGIYLVDGVVASIEVKSRIDKRRLVESLDNCMSVTRMPPSVMSRTVSIQLQTMKSEVIGDAPTFQPSTYIFGFRSSSRTLNSMGNQIDNWWDDNHLGASDIGKLPDVIVAGEFVALSSGKWVTVGVEGDLARKVREDSGDNAEIAMGVWKVEHPFAWLLMHLLATSAKRFSEAHQPAVSKYLPMMEYWKAEMEGHKSSVIYTP